MKAIEDHSFTFEVDYTADGKITPYVTVDLVDNDEPILFYGFNSGATIDQAKQLIECMQAAVDKYEEINK